MGSLIDAVLAVSTLAIASAVAWADWVMSCCGIGVGLEACLRCRSDNAQSGKRPGRG